VFSLNGRIRTQTQDWLEHVKWVEEGRVPKQALWYRSKGRRNSGRPLQKAEQAIGLTPELEEGEKK
jgi:hypothetical protein